MAVYVFFVVIGGGEIVGGGVSAIAVAVHFVGVDGSVG